MCLNKYTTIQVETQQINLSDENISCVCIFESKTKYSTFLLALRYGLPDNNYGWTLFWHRKKRHREKSALLCKIR